MSSIRRLAGQTAIYGIPSILGRFLNFLLVPLYTYGILTRQEYGIVNVYYSYTALLMVILTYGMETAFFRFTETEEKKERVFSTGIISVLITSVAFLLFTNLLPGTIASWIDYPQHPEFIIWFSWILALDAISAIPFARLRAENRPVLFAAIKSVNIFTNIFLNLFFLLFLPYLAGHHAGNPMARMLLVIYQPHWDIEYIFLANLVSSIVTLLLLIPQVLKMRWGLDLSLWRRMLVYALPLLVAGMAGIINETVDRILLRYLLPAGTAEDQVGIYSACYKIAILMVLFIQAYRFAAEPFFFSQMKNSDARITYARVMDYFIVAVSFIYLLTMLFLDDFVIYFIGPEFREARNVIPVLMMAKVFLGVYYNLSIWYKLSGKTLWGALITLTGAAVTLVLNFVWIPLSPDHLIYGYMGSAWATFFCYSSMMILGYLLGRQYYPIPYNLLKIAGYPILALILFFLSRMVQIPVPALSILFHLSLLVIFSIAAWLIERPRPVRAG